jgi:isoleucyl-tRNA synthetase
MHVFQKMVAKGLIYRQFRPVHWSPSSRSALAEAELKYEEQHASKAAFVAFPVQAASIPSEILDITGRDPLALLIWTTTPWTLPANMVCSGVRLNTYTESSIPRPLQ